MKFRKCRSGWHPPVYRGKKHGILITVDRSEHGWYFYGGGHNSLRSGIGSFPTKEQAFEAAEKWCDMKAKNRHKTD
ncbi:hypothetical protein DNHGIG_25650 [Collibacillus ludicampi]|uniref:Uncharacterized protein n=1 Tax=Collibacillus ludicampi TaxID=2771369 RepID=A0AAV4LGR0_9BACL|nr:hypothetical protein [Collibacillus ludicampi]GIM47016.1 hypothetical protein DNHGIG_25650 [Collibacillus ludicampi]